jgi:hypothetical protein
MSRRQWGLPVAVGLASLVLYALTFISTHRFDAVGFVIAARSPDPRAWFTPHHLLYPWFGHALAGLAGADHLVRALQAVSAVAAATCVGIYAAILQRILHRRQPGIWPVLGAGLLGLSASFWVSAVESDAYALALASLAGATACYLRASESGRRWHVVAAIFASLGTLVHQMVVLFALAYALALALAGPRRRWPDVLAFGVPLGLMTGSVYLAVGLAHGFFHDPPSLWRWVTAYAYQGPWGPPGRARLIEGLYGFLYSVAAGAGGLVPSAVVRPVAVLGLIGALVSGWRSLRAAGGTSPARQGASAVSPMVTLGLCWLAIYVPFIVWHAAFTPAHWLFVTMPLVMLAVCAADAMGAKGSAARRFALVAAMVVLCVVIGTLNYVRVIAPLMAPDAAGAFAREALARMPARARVVAPIGVATLLVQERLGGDAVFVVPHRPWEGDPTAAVLARLRAFVERSRREDSPVWVFRSLMEPTFETYLGDPILRRAVADMLREIARDPRVVVLDTTTLNRPVRAP